MMKKLRQFFQPPIEQPFLNQEFPSPPEAITNADSAPHTPPDKSMEPWKERLDVLGFAFQPIVNLHTGTCYGYEVFLRNYDQLGFRKISDFFNQAYHDQQLSFVELSLRDKAFELFASLPFHHSMKLFLNLDSRLLETRDYLPSHNAELLDKRGLTHDSVCFEISEQQDQFIGETIGVLSMYRAEGFRIAVDDFGTGISELQLFYYLAPDFIKIDRFFIRDIATDSKKKLLVSNIINMAHTLGTIVVAVGVETEKEFYCCRDIGFDYVQGYLVQYPTTEITQLKSRYEHIHLLAQQDRRSHSSDQQLIQSELEMIPVIDHRIGIEAVFDMFLQHKKNTFFPVLGQNREPLGVIRETDLKDYTYSKYGRDLLKNPGVGKKLRDFITPIPMADLYTSVEKTLEVFSMNEHVEGILIVDQMRYVGFLSAQSLLRILNEKNVSIAREQNPLTKLPGNIVIHEYISKALDAPHSIFGLVYFDFDNFKPFNDKYGFRLGDRAILLFADLLKEQGKLSQIFVGHIGGDDFFMGFQDTPIEATAEKVRRLRQHFSQDVESFYDPQARKDGYIISKDREGQLKKFNLLTVSAVILELPSPRNAFTTEQLSNILAKYKKAAKHSEDGLSIVNVEQFSQ